MDTHEHNVIVTQFPRKHGTFGNIMIKHDFSLYLTLLGFTFFTPGLDALAINFIGWCGMDFDPANAENNIWSKDALQVYFANALIIAAPFLILLVPNFFYKFMKQRPLKKVAQKLNELEQRHDGKYASGENAEHQLKTILCEVRSTFCKYYASNEISLTLFKVDNTPYRATAYLHVNEDGFVDKAKVPATFAAGEGFCGIALEQNASSFGRQRHVFGLFKDQRYKQLDIDDDSMAYSFWCIPIRKSKTDRDTVVYVLAVETSRMKYFDFFAKKDPSNKDIAHNVDIIFSSVYNCIHNEKK